MGGNDERTQHHVCCWFPIHVLRPRLGLWTLNLDLQTLYGVCLMTKQTLIHTVAATFNGAKAKIAGGAALLMGSAVAHARDHQGAETPLFISRGQHD